MKTIITLLFVFILLSAQSQERGSKVEVTIDIDGISETLYDESHALIIGVSEYSDPGWPDLPGVAKDVVKVAAVLDSMQFQVDTMINPTSWKIKNGMEEFISKYGRLSSKVRLLIYFSGHGYSSTLQYGGTMGFFVPSDAPDPNIDLLGFKSKAIDMKMMELWAEEMEILHALFLFDCCYSGTFFSPERSKYRPEAISYKIKKPVRLFIAAGAQDETVPDESIFCKQFTEAISGLADNNSDYYITGNELCDFIYTTVTNYSNGTQHPEYAKIKNPNLDKGDIVFVTNYNNQNISDSINDNIFNLKYGSIAIQTEFSGDLFIDGSFKLNLDDNTLVAIDSVLVGMHDISIKGAFEWNDRIYVSYNKATIATAKLSNGVEVSASDLKLGPLAIHFDIDKSILTQENIKLLDEIASFLLKDSKIKLKITGHTEITGAEGYNMELSKYRAESVEHYLIDSGVNPSQIILEWYGASQPIADNKTIEGRAMNRRVELVLIY